MYSWNKSRSDFFYRKYKAELKVTLLAQSCLSQGLVLAPRNWDFFYRTYNVYRTVVAYCYCRILKLPVECYLWNLIKTVTDNLHYTDSF